jgi:hypothetical protein
MILAPRRLKLNSKFASRFKVVSGEVHWNILYTIIYKKRSTKIFWRVRK